MSCRIVRSSSVVLPTWTCGDASVSFSVAEWVRTSRRRRRDQPSVRYRAHPAVVQVRAPLRVCSFRRCTQRPASPPFRFRVPVAVRRASDCAEREEAHLCPIIPRIHCPCPFDNDLSPILLECPGYAGRSDLARDGDALVLERDLVALDAWLVADGIFAVRDAGIAMSGGSDSDNNVRGAYANQSAVSMAEGEGECEGRTALRRALS